MDRDPEVTRHIPGPWGDPLAHRRFVLDRAASLKLARKLGMRALDVVEDEYGSWLRHRLDAPGAACSP
ncbi:hypothetical protein LA03_37490 [Burkholderia gladioli]|nr:hypothetical protein LA03_37490 [Burkholderia gladioli]